jgi:hypothetical protein
LLDLISSSSLSKLLNAVIVESIPFLILWCLEAVEFIGIYCLYFKL